MSEPTRVYKTSEGGLSPDAVTREKAGEIIKPYLCQKCGVACISVDDVRLIIGNERLSRLQADPIRRNGPAPGFIYWWNVIDYMQHPNLRNEIGTQKSDQACGFGQGELDEDLAGCLRKFLDQERHQAEAYRLEMVKEQRRVAELEGRIRSAERHGYNVLLGNFVDDFMSDCLVTIAGAVCTPERGYLEDGGLELLLSDISRLRKQHDAYESIAVKLAAFCARLSGTDDVPPDVAKEGMRLAHEFKNGGGG